MPPAHYRLFVQQLANYPLGHDDLLDAVAYYSDIGRLRPPRAERKLTHEEEARKELEERERRFADELVTDGPTKRRMQATDFVGLPGLREP